MSPRNDYVRQLQFVKLPIKVPDLGTPAFIGYQSFIITVVASPLHLLYTVVSVICSEFVNSQRVHVTVPHKLQ